MKFYITALCIYITIGLSRGFLGRGNKQATTSSFIPSNSVDQKGVQLIQNASQLLLSPNSEQNNTQSSGTIVPYQSLLSYNILQAVQASAQRQIVVSTYLDQLQTTIQWYQTQILGYQDKINQSQTILTQCTTQKKQSDSIIITAINNDSIANLDSLMESSINAASCQAQQQISINTRNLVLSRQQAIQNALQRRYSVIQEYQSQIITYPELITNTELLQELNTLSIQMN